MLKILHEVVVKVYVHSTLSDFVCGISLDMLLLFSVGVISFVQWKYKTIGFELLNCLFQNTAF